MSKSDKKLKKSLDKIYNEYANMVDVLMDLENYEHAFSNEVVGDLLALNESVEKIGKELQKHNED